MYGIPTRRSCRYVYIHKHRYRSACVPTPPLRSTVVGGGVKACTAPLGAHCVSNFRAVRATYRAIALRTLPSTFLTFHYMLRFIYSMYFSRH